MKFDLRPEPAKGRALTARDPTPRGNVPAPRHVYLTAADLNGAKPVKQTIRACVICSGLIFGLSACTNPYDPAQRFVGGGLLGAASGAAIGAAAGGGPGAAMGAAIGAAAGAFGGAATTPPPPPYGYYGYPSYYGYPGYYGYSGYPGYGYYGY